MNTHEYINELKIQLRKMNDDDREDAIAYYFEYLAEAGPEGAKDAMDRLGTPAELAAGIRADQAMLEFEDPSEGGATVQKGVKAVWLAGLAAVPRTILAGFVTVIVIIVFFAVIIALFATSVGLIGGGIIGIIGFAGLMSIGGAAVAVFYLGCGLALGGLGFLLFRASIWCSKHLLHGIAAVFNGIRRKREKKSRKGGQAK